MKQNYLILALVVLAAALFWKGKHKVIPDINETNIETVISPNVKNVETLSTNEVKPIASPTGTPVDKHGVELASLNKMTQTILDFSNNSKRFEDLMFQLKNENQEPYISQDRNAFTGELTIVRTKSPLPGTRYFHAQYFSDENGEKFLQHMSFQSKPGDRKSVV